MLCLCALSGCHGNSGVAMVVTVEMVVMVSMVVSVVLAMVVSVALVSSGVCPCLDVYGRYTCQSPPVRLTGVDCKTVLLC